MNPEDMIFNEEDLSVLLNQYYLLECRVKKIWAIYADEMTVEWNPIQVFDVNKTIDIVLYDGREYYLPREWLTVSNSEVVQSAIQLYNETTKEYERKEREKEIAHLKARLATLEALQ